MVRLPYIIFDYRLQVQYVELYTEQEGTERGILDFEICTEYEYSIYLDCTE